jgi:hypothetical protein
LAKGALRKFPLGKRGTREDLSTASEEQRAPIKDPALLERHIAALPKAGLE